MKKTKRVKKGQVALAVMVVALGAAVWLNMKYTGAVGDASADDISSKFLGQAEYVNAEVEEKEEKSDYFEKFKKDRKEAHEKALDILQETLDRDDLTDGEKADAVARSTAIAKAVDDEAAIEAVLKAKSFKNCAVMIGENDVSVVVQAESLNAAQTAQIRDAVTSRSGFSAAAVKIITVE